MQIFFRPGHPLQSYQLWEIGYQSWETDEAMPVPTTASGSAGASSKEITALGSPLLLFSTSDGNHDTDTWATGGTTADATAPTENSASGGLPPNKILSPSSPFVLFTANDGTHGKELWVTDGTGAGTTLVMDINPGVSSSYPGPFTDLGTGKVVFEANDGTHGDELWVTDGTTAGTALVKDINPGSGAASPRYVTALGSGKAVFSAYDVTHGTELWVTDGTSAGTTLVKDINPGASQSFPSHITSLGIGKAVFSANDATHGNELWVTDGTSAGTSLVKDINPGSGNSLPSNFTLIGNGEVVFSARDATHGYELWVTDGTAAGTALLKDIDAGAANGYPRVITALGSGYFNQFIPDGKAVFSARDATHGYELWVTDGTAAGTALVMDINPGLASSSPGSFGMIAFGNGKALFSANDGTHGYELWVTDGTTAGTSLVTDINPGSSGSYAAGFTALGNGKVLFDAIDATHGRELWVTDGTAAGTMLVKDINPGSANSNPSYIAAIGHGEALFRATDGTHGYELWQTDGTAAGTILLDDIKPGSSGSYPSNITLIPCYRSGTRILTENGELPVEELAIGDRVVTISGGMAPIKWIGQRAYDGRFITGNLDVLPIRVAAGAIGDGIPARDLWLSPEHALYLDGVLAAARLLVNGKTVTQAQQVEELVYFHIELDTHDIILAECAPAESYVECDNRAMFHNAGEFAVLYPEDERPSGQFCAPRLIAQSGELAPIRAALLQRAAVLGFGDPLAAAV